MSTAYNDCSLVWLLPTMTVPNYDYDWSMITVITIAAPYW